MSACVRRATEADLPLLLSAEARLFPADPWGGSALAGHVAAPHTVSLLLFLDGAFAGYLLAGFSPPEGELYRVAVLPEYRRRGFGRSLLSGLFREADERQADSIWLEVRESNVAARSLYAAAGFALVSRRENYYRDPREAALVMKRERPKES